MGCHFLLQEIIPTWRLNAHLCIFCTGRRILYHCSEGGAFKVEETALQHYKRARWHPTSWRKTFTVGEALRQPRPDIPPRHDGAHELTRCGPFHGCPWQLLGRWGTLSPLAASAMHHDLPSRRVDSSPTPPSEQNRLHSLLLQDQGDLDSSAVNSVHT